MNVEETKKYIDRRMNDVGLGVRLDGPGYQEIQNFTNGNGERLNQLYYKLVSVGSRQEKREIDRVTIQIAIDDLRRIDQFMEHMPMKVEHGSRLDVDRMTIEQLASSLEQKVAEEMESAVGAARRKVAAGADVDIGGNGADRGAPVLLHAVTAAKTAGKPRILVVDDSPTIRAAVTKALENDFELLQASDGEKGWKLLCANSDIKLVVTDLMMPQMDGFGLIERIRSAKVPGVSGLPIIVVTALEDPQSKVHALVAGANDFITKSTDTLELHARVVARYQLSQIVGNGQYAGGNGVRSPRESGIPRQVSVPPGTKSPRTADPQPTNAAWAVERHGNGGRIPSNGSVSDQVEAQMPRRHSRLDRTTKVEGVTVVASFLVVAGILGMYYFNDKYSIESVVKSPDAFTSAATPEAAAPLPADPVQAPDSSDAVTGSSDGAPALSAGSWATADGAPTREKLVSVPDEMSGNTDTPTSTSTKVAAAEPAQPPVERQPKTVTETKKPPVTAAAASRAASSKPATAATKSKPDVTIVPPPRPPARAPGLETATAKASSPPTPSEPLAQTPGATPLAAEPVAPASSGTAPELQVATARPPRTDFGSTPSAQLTQTELSNLIKRFVFVYQAGDIQQFLGLFDDNIHTNDRASKAGLRQDYEELFRGTSMRQMVLGDIAWDIKDRQADGVANFEVRVRKIDEDDVKAYQGSLSFHVEKTGGRARITRMYHGQWKAQN